MSLTPEQARAFAAELLRNVPADVICGGNADGGVRRDTPAGESTSDSEVPSSESRIPEEIGGCRIESVLGAGGMGVVYKAHEVSPPRRVALKVMRRAILSPSSRRRFHFEVETLASLDHPGIACLYRAGMHDDGEGGSPYFVMEYIPDAEPLTQYCERRQLAMHDRLRIFLDVCDAVQHAHQKGVIHRDLKPSNIVVGAWCESDRPDAAVGAPAARVRVKVIDFGVARATDSDVTMTTVHTGVSNAAGTLAYMSPEQTMGSSRNLDTRCDVYALGVVLYELTCGRLPYDLSAVLEMEAPRLVREQLPARPSRVRRDVRGDLETIILKSLEKDPERRYHSADALQRDLERYLKDQPIEARPPSLRYQLSCLARRYPWQLAAALLVLALTIAGSLAFQSNRYAGRLAVQQERIQLQAYGRAMSSAASAIANGNRTEARRQLESADAAYRDAFEYRLLGNLLDQSVQTIRFSATSGVVRSLGVHPTRPVAATVLAHDRALRLVATDGSDSISVLPFDHDPVEWATFHPDGSLMLLAGPRNSPDGEARSAYRIYDLRDEPPSLVRSWQCESRNVADSFFVSRPNAEFVVTQQQNDVLIWDISEESAPPNEAILVGGIRTRGDAQALAVDHAGTRFAVGTWGANTIAIYDIDDALRTFDAARGLSTATALAHLRGHESNPLSSAFSADDRLLATGDAGGQVCIWNVERSIESSEDGGVLAERVPDQRAGVLALAFHPSEPFLASAGEDENIRVRQVFVDSDGTSSNPATTARSRLVAMQGGHAEPVGALQFATDGSLLSAASDGTIHRWHLAVEAPALIRGLSTSVNQVTFDDGRLLSSGGSAGYGIVVTDLADMSTNAPEWAALYGVASFAIARDESPDAVAAVILTQGDVPCELRLCDASHPPVLPFVADVGTLGAEARSVALSESGALVAAADGASGRVRVWNVTNPETPLVVYDDHVLQTGIVRDLCFLDADGATLLVAGGKSGWAPDESEPGTLAIVRTDVRSGVAFSLKTGSSISSVDYRARDRLLACGLCDGRVVVFRFDPGAVSPLVPVERLSAHSGEVLAVAFHPTEPRVATGGWDRLIRIWDTVQWIEVAALVEAPGHINDLEFSADGDLLAAASSGFQGVDNVARLWDASRPADLHDRRRAQDVSRRARLLQLGRDSELIMQLNDAAWLRLIDSSFSLSDHAEAARWAERAVVLAQGEFERGTCLSTFAFAQLRTEDYRGAITSADDSDALFGSAQARNALVVAVAAGRLGESDRRSAARATFASLVEKLAPLERTELVELMREMEAEGPHSGEDDIGSQQ